MIEIAEIVKENPARIVEWANAITYNDNISSEDREISAEMDAWAKNLGRTGHDRDHEISQMITNTFTPDAVELPSELLDRMFDFGSIGEFDDEVIEVAPKNTLRAYDAAYGGNVDRSFIDTTLLKPTWKHLQIETDISLRDVRRGGFKTVANLLTFIDEAFEMKRLATVIEIIDSAITSGAAGYVSEAGSAPTETSASALATYMTDVADGAYPLMFGMNKYINAISKLSGSTTYLTDAAKDMYRKTGRIDDYAGCELFGVSGTRKLGDGTLLIPDKRVFGAAGKIGKITMRGDINALQETDINSEKIHIKVNGYHFGVAITDPEKVGKIVMAQ